MDNVRTNKIQKCNAPSSISFRCIFFNFKMDLIVREYELWRCERIELAQVMSTCDNEGTDAG
jgi:hypothetical protein